MEKLACKTFKTQHIELKFSEQVSIANFNKIVNFREKILKNGRARGENMRFLQQKWRNWHVKLSELNILS